MVSTQMSTNQGQGISCSSETLGHMTLSKMKTMAFERGMRPEEKAFAKQGNILKHFIQNKNLSYQLLSSPSQRPLILPILEICPLSDGQLYYVLHFWEG